MQLVYAMNNNDNRKLKYLYLIAELTHRYSVIPDYSRDVNRLGILSANREPRTLSLHLNNASLYLIKPPALFPLTAINEVYPWPD
jgi:hypothetical protein